MEEKQMKKMLTLLICVVLVFSLFSCGKEEETSGNTYEIAMITASETSSIDDQSYTQNTWEGLREYAEENGITYKYYEPLEESIDGRLEQIDEAIQSGAKVVVCCGREFEPVIHTAQEKYSDKHFILIDGYPTDKKGEQKTASNTVGVKFAENELGYLAGYGAVSDGYRALGFMGESTAASVKSYGYGFIEGCNDAAAELGAAVEINYNYKKDSDTAAKIQKRAESWYEEGTEVIFACGDGIFDSVLAEADIAKAKVIGCGTDRSGRSKNVLTSAIKVCGIAAKSQLTSFYQEEFAGGENLVFGAAEGAVILPMKTSRFETFDQEAFRALYQSLKNGKLKISSAEDAAKVNDLIRKKKLNSVYVTLTD